MRLEDSESGVTCNKDNIMRVIHSTNAIGEIEKFTRGRNTTSTFPMKGLVNGTSPNVIDIFYEKTNDTNVKSKRLRLFE